MNIHSLLILSPPKLKGLAKDIALITKFKDESLFMNVHECHNLDDFIEEIKSKDAPDFILVFESIHACRLEKEKARTETLQVLKDIKFQLNSKIVVIISNSKESETHCMPFINELIKLNIHDFYFEDKISSSDIVEKLFLPSKTLKDNQKYIITDIIPKEIIKEIKIEVPKYVEVPVERESRRSFFIREKEATKEVSIIGSKSNTIIGIVGASRGCGVTRLCVNFAAKLAEYGQKVLILDRSENQHLNNMEIKGQEIKSCPLYEVDIKKYDYIIIDFGVIAEIDISGKVIPKPDMTNEKKLERQYCNEIVFVASSLPWRLYELETYIEHAIFEVLTNEWIFYVNGEDNILYEKTKKKYEKDRLLLTEFDYDDPLAELYKTIESREEYK